MEAYSMDLRRRVLAAYDRGEKTHQIAQQFSVSPAWARRLKQNRSEGKGIAPRPCGGSKPKLDEQDRQQLLRFVQEQPDATLEELRQRIARELQITVSTGCLWNTLRALKFSLKKSRCTPPSNPGRM